MKPRNIAQDLIKVRERIEDEKTEAMQKAIDALARYKFMMFGYWAAVWVHLNKMSEYKEPNPFVGLVRQAKETRKANYGL
jgi:hypothetical protein